MGHCTVHATRTYYQETYVKLNNLKKIILHRIENIKIIYLGA